MRPIIKIVNEKHKLIIYETEQIKKRQRIYRFIRDNHPNYFNIQQLRKLTNKITKMMGGEID